MTITTSNKKRIEAIKKVYGLISVLTNKSVITNSNEEITAWYIKGFSFDELVNKLSDEEIETLYDSGL